MSGSVLKCDPAAAPLVSVIIPVWNRAAELAECLRALERQTFRDFEVIVADNGSTDDSVAVARGFGAVVVVQRRPGSYAARNLALSYARGQYVAFTDSDCRAHPRWLERALEAAKSSSDGAVIAGHVALDGEDESLCAAFERLFAFNQKSNVNNKAVATANWFSPIEIVRDAGGFRPDLKSGGDYELARRLAESGVSLTYDPEVIVFHPPRTTVSELAAKARRVIGGRLSIRGGRNIFRWAFVLSTKETARRILKVWRGDRVRVSMNIMLTALLIYLLGVTLSEVVRVRLGGEARRA